MPNKEQIIKAMDEWLSTEGLHPSEENMILELKRNAGISVATFYANATFFGQAMPEVVISAVNKARSQGKCKEWPSA